MFFRQLAAGAALIAVGFPTSALSNEFEGALRSFSESELAGWVAEPALIEAIRSQNAAHGTLDQARIDEMDKTWRSSIGSPDAAIISDVVNNPSSEWLRTQKDAYAGIITEVIVMDHQGLNVAVSDVTSDYWQGDEAKFQQTYPMGPGAVHISDVEFDESSQTYQSQVSMVVLDADGSTPIGAITFGLNVELLP